MALIVQKFGGSSVADRDRIFNVARIVANTHAAGNDVVVVVSAQGDTTDDLIAKAGEITHDPSQREMDMLLATGEQISISLLAMALGETGCPAISLTGWQAGFHTDRAYTRARIKNLDTERIESELSKNRVVVVAGFQGLNRYDDITTLGRGGSDTSAVAIAAALHADLCQIYTDVDGVYTADPRLVPRARKLDEITFDPRDSGASCALPAGRCPQWLTRCAPPGWKKPRCQRASPSRARWRAEAWQTSPRRSPIPSRRSLCRWATR